MNTFRFFLAAVMAVMVGLSPALTLAGCTPTNNYVASFKGPEYNVKTYGATPGDLVDDTGAIQDAFDAAELTGGTIVFPPGVYKTSGAAQAGSTAIAIDGGENIKIMGYGATIHQGASSARVLGVFRSSNVHIRGLKILGYTGVLDSSTENHSLITVNHLSNNVSIEDCFLSNSLGDCIYVGGSILDGATTGQSCKGITIAHNVLKTRYGNGVESNAAGSNSRMAVAVTEGDNLNITNNTLYGAIDLEPNAAYQGVRFANVADNLFLSGPVRPQAVIGSTYWHDEALVDNGGLTEPTVAPTLATATTGGTIAAGDYYAVVTYYNADGETARSPESLVVTTTGATSTITVTGGAIPAGATGVKVYITPGSASPATEVYSSLYTSGTSVVITALPSASAAWPPTLITGGVALTGVSGTSDTDHNIIQNNNIEIGSISFSNVFRAVVNNNVIKEGRIIVGASSGSGTSDARVSGNRIRKIPSAANSAIYVELASTSSFQDNEVISGASKYMFELVNNSGRNVYSNNRFMDLSGTGLFTGALVASDVAVSNTKLTNTNYSPPVSTAQQGAWIHNVAEIALTGAAEVVDWRDTKADFWNLSGNGYSLSRVASVPDGTLLTIRSGAFGGGVVTVLHNSSYIRMVDGANWTSSTGGESITFHAYSGILWEVARSAAYPTTYLPVAKGGTGAATLAGANIGVLNAVNSWSAANTFTATTTTFQAAAPVVSLVESGVRNWALRSGAVATNKFDIADLTAGASRVAIDQNGAVEIPGTLSIGSGTPITKALSAAATLDFPDTADGASADLTITVTGAADGDVVSLGKPATSVPAGNCDYHAWVSGADTVTVRFLNSSGGNLNPASGSFRAMVTKF